VEAAGLWQEDMVEEKERLLRVRGLPDLFAGMKADENAIAAALFPRVAAEIDDIWHGYGFGVYGSGFKGLRFTV
jgi:hypothetical protein